MPVPVRRAYTLIVAEPGDALLDEAFALSRIQYQRHFGCRLGAGYPGYFCLLRDRRLLATCGFRTAEGALFLEQYLDEPAEAALGHHFRTPVSRSRIVELGGFAIRRGALAPAFMSLLAPALLARGYSHAIATATMPVRRCLTRIGTPFVRIAAAEEDRLRDDGSRWGIYYRMRPAVIAGSIRSAVDALEGRA
jgi:hypothetical protein